MGFSRPLVISNTYMMAHLHGKTRSGSVFLLIIIQDCVWLLIKGKHFTLESKSPPPFTLACFLLNQLLN